MEKQLCLGGIWLEGKMNLKKTVVFLIVCITFFSCDKFLEESPKDKLPEDEVYNNISDVYLNAVASLYTYIGGYSDSQGLQGTGRGVYDLNTFTTDEAIIPTRGGDWYDGGFWQGLFLHQWGIENDAIQATWEYLYKVVMLSNKSLERIDKFSATHADAELPAYRAEVRAMRAMYYYYLMDLFGRVPLILTSSPSMKDVVQSERKTIFDFVFKELQEFRPFADRSPQQPVRSVLRTNHPSRSCFPLGKACLECRSLCRQRLDGRPASRRKESLFRSRRQPPQCLADGYRLL